MGTYATNAAGFETDRLAFDIRHEPIGGMLVEHLSATVTVPPRVLHQWHLIDLCTPGASANKPWLAREAFLHVRPMWQPPRTDVYSRVISAWCTHFDDTSLAYAFQTDRLVQYHADLPYDKDWDSSRTTGGALVDRACKGAWPPGYAHAAYIRLECERAQGYGDAAKLGIAQITAGCGNHSVEGTTNDGKMWFRAQAKGLTRESQREAYADFVRVVIPPGPKEGLLTLQVSEFSKGIWLASGFELKAAMPEFAPTTAPPVPPVDPVRAAVAAVLPALRLFSDAMEGEGL